MQIAILQICLASRVFCMSRDSHLRAWDILHIFVVRHRRFLIVKSALAELGLVVWLILLVVVLEGLAMLVQRNVDLSSSR